MSDHTAKLAIVGAYIGACGMLLGALFLNLYIQGATPGWLTLQLITIGLFVFGITTSIGTWMVGRGLENDQ